MQFIEYDAVGVKAVLVRHIGGKHLIKAVCRLIHELFLRFEYFHPFR